MKNIIDMNENQTKLCINWRMNVEVIYDSVTNWLTA